MYKICKKNFCALISRPVCARTQLRGNIDDSPLSRRLSRPPAAICAKLAAKIAA